MYSHGQWHYAVVQITCAGSCLLDRTVVAQLMLYRTQGLLYAFVNILPLCLPLPLQLSRVYVGAVPEDTAGDAAAGDEGLQLLALQVMS
jgi:hypothetical protein